MDRTIRSGADVLRVRCRPVGSELRDLTADPSVRWVQWFSALPGILSLVGWVLHHTVFKSMWFVTAERVGPDAGDLVRVEDLRKKEALRVFDDLVAAILDGEPLTEFRKDGSLP